jgi:hypothetical protein
MLDVRRAPIDQCGTFSSVILFEASCPKKRSEADESIRGLNVYDIPDPS